MEGASFSALIFRLAAIALVISWLALPGHAEGALFVALACIMAAELAGIRKASWRQAEMMEEALDEPSLESMDADEAHERRLVELLHLQLKAKELGDSAGHAVAAGMISVLLGADLDAAAAPATDTGQ